MAAGQRYQVGGVHVEADRHDAEAVGCTYDETDACGPRVASLGHQCDRWVIGGEAEVRALIRDLEEILRTGRLSS